MGGGAAVPARLRRPRCSSPWRPQHDNSVMLQLSTKATLAIPGCRARVLSRRLCSVPENYPWLTTHRSFPPVRFRQCKQALAKRQASQMNEQNCAEPPGQATLYCSARFALRFGESSHIPRIPTSIPALTDSGKASCAAMAQPSTQQGAKQRALAASASLT